MRAPLLVWALLSAGAPGAPPPAPGAPPPAPGAAASQLARVRIETDLGDIEVEVDLAHAPVTAANFLRYLETGRYDGGRFHRTVRPDNQPDSPVRIDVVQGGVAPERERDDFPPIPLERTRDTGLAHLDGTVSMARDGPDTATGDFFICIGAQPELDFAGARNPDGQGFAAFGRVVSGMEVVRRIWRSPAQAQAIAPPVAIRRVRRLARVESPTPASRPRFSQSAPGGPACQRLRALFPQAAIPEEALDCRAGLETSCRDGRGQACTALVAVLQQEGGSDAERLGDLLERGCLAGDGEACFELAGRAAPERRAGLLESGCASGSGRACAAAARTLPACGTAALQRLERACDLGSGEGCRGLSTCPVPAGRPRRRRLALLERGCALDDGPACSAGGVLRQAGLDPHDPERAARLFDRGCSLLDSPSCAHLALALLHGSGVAPDPGRGRGLLARHCEALGPTTCLDAAQAWLGGPGPLLDGEPGLELLRAACRRDSAPACHRLGRALQEGVRVEADGAGAAAAYDRACQGGLAQACADLAALVRLGVGGPADATRARSLEQRACRAGLAEACRQLEEDGAPP